MKPIEEWTLAMQGGSLPHPQPGSPHGAQPVPPHTLGCLPVQNPMNIMFLPRHTFLPVLKFNSSIGHQEGWGHEPWNVGALSQSPTEPCPAASVYPQGDPQELFRPQSSGGHCLVLLKRTPGEGVPCLQNPHLLPWGPVTTPVLARGTGFDVQSLS